MRSQLIWVSLLWSLCIAFTACAGATSKPDNPGTSNQAKEYLPELDAPKSAPNGAQLLGADLSVTVEPVLVASEWPNVKRSGTENWYAEPPIDWRRPLAIADTLFQIPTEVPPESVEFWFYDTLDTDGIPQHEPVDKMLCDTQESSTDCVYQESSEGWAIKLPTTSSEFQLIVVQAAWQTGPSDGEEPLIARLSWAIRSTSDAS